jgi:hypothetical protein
MLTTKDGAFVEPRGCNRWPPVVQALDQGALVGDVAVTGAFGLAHAGSPWSRGCTIASVPVSPWSRWLRKRRSRRLFRDDEEAEEGHRGGGHDRVQQPGDGERDRGDVVRERPEEVALDRREHAPREPDRDIGAGSDREERSGLAPGATQP